MKKSMFRAIFFLASASLFPFSAVFGECNFNTSEYIEELHDPGNLKSIAVNISNNKKWTRNSLKLITDISKIAIGKKYKKRFKAEVKAEYPFGTCTFKAKVRQSGDWKDHVGFENGGLVNSLDVKLANGNILNAVRFKLFIPSTRNGKFEVLGALILKEFGFVSPETFLVRSELNGHPADYLFQEKTAKELLERNMRREGPMIEGDESLMWSAEKGDNKDSERYLLARIINGKWIEKGKNSALMSLRSLLALQRSYLVHSQGLNLPQEKETVELAMNPNVAVKNPFYDYALLTLAFNGGHALRPHNRKFYYNALSDLIEPVYYDGVFHLTNEKSYVTEYRREVEYLLSFFDANELDSFIEKLDGLTESESFLQAFQARSLIHHRWLADTFVQETIANWKKNLSAMIDIHQGITEQNSESNAFVTDFLNRDITQGIDHHATEITNRNLDIFIGKIDFTGNRFRLEADHPNRGTFLEEYLDLKELSKVLSKNEWGESRVHVLSSHLDSDLEEPTKTDFLGGEIVHSGEGVVEIDRRLSKVTFSQAKPADWILFRNLEFPDGWEVEMIGKEADPSLRQEQRFNRFNLTGCLNFYAVKFNGTSIRSSLSQCEDSVNIISSEGALKKIVVTESFSDAVDVDFSDAEIAEIRVSKAGNDCLDFSGGNYRLGLSELEDCGDKGISAGEKSTVNARSLVVKRAEIGLSSKDYSVTEVAEYSAEGVKVCAEAFNKKQEFGGGVARFGSFRCSGEVNKDKNSTVEIKPSGGADEL